MNFSRLKLTIPHGRKNSARFDKLVSQNLQSTRVDKFIRIHSSWLDDSRESCKILFFEMGAVCVTISFARRWRLLLFTETGLRNGATWTMAEDNALRLRSENFITLLGSFLSIGDSLFLCPLYRERIRKFFFLPRLKFLSYLPSYDRDVKIKGMIG